MELASLNPRLAAIRKPSKMIAVVKTIDYIKSLQSDNSKLFIRIRELEDRFQVPEDERCNEMEIIPSRDECDGDWDGNSPPLTPSPGTEMQGKNAVDHETSPSSSVNDSSIPASRIINTSRGDPEINGALFFWAMESCSPLTIFSN